MTFVTVEHSVESIVLLLRQEPEPNHSNLSTDISYETKVLLPLLC